jgi:DNA repair protein RadC
MRQGRLHVKDWPEDQRPRERLLAQGARSLSLTDLLAILLGTGPAGISSVDLAMHLIATVAHDRSKKAAERMRPVEVEDDIEIALRFLRDASAVDLQELKGIGPAKAVTLLAAVELGRRVAELGPSPQVTGPTDAARIVAREWVRRAERELAGRDREHACVLFLDTKHRVVGVKTIATGTLNEVMIHPRDVFREALKSGAFAVILAHNHPSGDPTPSQADLALTRRLVEAARLVGVELVDHLIVGRGHTVSLRAQGHFG